MEHKCTFEGCFKTFPCKSKLQDHINSHLDLRSHICEICGKGYTCKRYLRAHLESHSEPMKCEKCGAHFTRRFKLKKHRCPVVYKCEYCSKKYRKRACFESHVSKCVVMNTAMRENKIMNTTVMKESKISTRARLKSKIVECEICKARFCGKRNLIEHKKTVHEGRRFPCTFCDKVYRYACSLKKHVKRDHS